MSENSESSEVTAAICQPADVPAGMAAVCKPADPSATAQPVISFEHSFFAKLENPRFQLSEQTGEAVLMITMAKTDVSLPFRGLKREFGLSDDHPDAQMLDMVAKSLQYVKGLRIGDPIPKEILTREASWSLQPRHVTIAYQRVSLQLVNWMTGGDAVISDPEQLMQLVDDPKIKKNVNRAFTEAAQKLGLGDNREEVITLVQSLAHELAYIEALRDRFRAIQALDAKIQHIRRLYGRERRVFDVADQVARLMERASGIYRDCFLNLDAQTGEILSVLRNLTAQISYIRDRRDELYIKLVAWEDILDMWSRMPAKISKEVPDYLRKTYQFLAPRYMMVNEWVLVTKARPGGQPGGQTQLTDENSKTIKPIAAMRW